MREEVKKEEGIECSHLITPYETEELEENEGLQKLYKGFFDKNLLGKMQSKAERSKLQTKDEAEPLEF